MSLKYTPGTQCIALDTNSCPESKMVNTSFSSKSQISTCTSWKAILTNMPIRGLLQLICSNQKNFFSCHPIYPSSDSWLKVKLTDSSQQNVWHQTCFLLYSVDRADPQMADSNTEGNCETRRTRTAKKNCNKGISHPITYYTQLLNIPKVYTVKQTQILWKIASPIILWKFCLNNRQNQNMPTWHTLW